MQLGIPNAHGFLDEAKSDYSVQLGQYVGTPNVCKGAR